MDPRLRGDDEGGAGRRGRCGTTRVSTTDVAAQRSQNFISSVARTLRFTGVSVRIVWLPAPGVK